MGFETLLIGGGILACNRVRAPFHDESSVPIEILRGNPFTGREDRGTAQGAAGSKTGEIPGSARRRTGPDDCSEAD